MLLTDKNARAILGSQLQPGETLEHHAYGVTQPPRPLLVLMYVFLTIPAALLVRRFTKHFLVGLTDRRLIVLRFTNAERPSEVLSYERPSLRANGKDGWLWTHLEVLDPARPLRLKLHHAAMPHNREHAVAILAALTTPLAQMAPAPGAFAMAMGGRA